MSKITSKEEHHTKVIKYTSRIVGAYLQSNKVDVNDIPKVIFVVYQALYNCQCDDQNQNGSSTCTFGDNNNKQTIYEDYLVCLEDNKHVKMLRPYLKRKHNLTPQEYIRKWNLPHDYPMTCPAYTDMRRKLAKKIRLGKNKKEYI